MMNALAASNLSTLSIAATEPKTKARNDRFIFSNKDTRMRKSTSSGGKSERMLHMK